VIVAYVYPEELPSKKARAISVVNSAYEVSKQTECTLFIDSNSNIDGLNNVYNLVDNDLDIKSVSKKLLWFKSNKFFNKNLLKELKKDKYDILYVRHLKAAKYLIEHKQKKQKVIFESHEIFYQTLEEESPDQLHKINKLKVLEEYVYKNCDGLVFVNKTLQHYMNKTFKDIQSKQTIIYNGMNFDDQYLKKDFINLDEIYYIGNFFYWKGLQEAIKVIPKLNGFRLEVIGGDSKARTNELKQFSQDLNIEEKIVFQGFKSSTEVKSTLQNEAKLTIIPNIKSIQNRFSMPIKLFEYMATSNIVIAADMETIKEIVIDGENGFLFKSGDLESLKTTIQRVLSLSNEELQQVAKNAYETSKDYTWAKRGEKIVEFAKGLIE